MALIILYLLSSILILIGIEPFKTAGIFLIICYLPGFYLFSFLKREKLTFEDLILAFPCSIGINSILILSLLFAGFHVKYIPTIIHIISGVITVLYIVNRSKTFTPLEKKSHLSFLTGFTAIKISRQELIFALFALLITLLLSIPIFIGPNRLSISGHAFFHSSLVTQILNGIFPPENPGLGGTKIGYYWGFHTLIAALTIKTSLQQLQIAFILNFISLYIIFCVAYCFAKAFDLSEVYRYIFPLAIIGLMRSDAGVFLIAKLFSGDLIPFDKMISSPVEPGEVIKSWLQGIPWFDSRIFFLHKFYNVSGMPLGISLCFSYVLLLLKLDEKNNGNRIYLINIAIVLIASFITYPPLSIFLLLLAPIWICSIFLLSRGNLMERIKESFKVLLPHIITIFFVLPYLLFVVTSREASSGNQGGILKLDVYEQSFRNIMVFLLPSPVIIYGLWITFKKLSFSRKFSFLLICTLLSLCLSIFTRLPFDDSYKFNYILTFFFGLFFVFGVSGFLLLFSNRRIKLFIIASVFLYIVLNPLIVKASYIVSSLSTGFTYIFSDKHIVYAQDKQKNEAYTWIRENTPSESLIMLSYIETNWPCCGLNNNYEPAAITERVLYVITDKDFTTSNPEFKKRVQLRKELFENPRNPEVINFFTLLNRPVYLLVEEKLPENRFFVEPIFKEFPHHPDKTFLLVFTNKRQRVYFIHLK